MDKEQLIEKIGSVDLNTEYRLLTAKLTYESGIPSFDSYLNGKTLKQIGAVIHLTKHVRGIAIKIAKNFSAFAFGLPFVEILNAELLESENEINLIFETAEGKIIFSLTREEIYETKYFLRDILTNNKPQNAKVEENKNFEVLEKDKNPIPAYIAIVSAILIIFGCFMPWIQLGALFQNRGIDNPDGAIMLVTAVITGALAVFNLSKKENKNLWVFILAGLIGGAVFYLDISEVNSRATLIKDGIDNISTSLGEKGDVSKINFIGSGLYVVLLGSVGLLVAGFGIFKQQLETSKSDS